MNWFQKTAQSVMNIQDVLNYLQQNDQLGYFKYVRCNGEYRFSDATSYMAAEHKQLVGNDMPESAGFIKIVPSGFYVEGFSTTLRLGPDSADEINLSHLLSMPTIDRFQ